jgi:ribokinase
MADIIVVGSLNMDLVIKTERMPRPGETIPGHSFQTIPGGKGANQAVAAARLGAQVAMVGRVGDDDFGPALTENLVGHGVEASHVGIDGEAATGIALIIVDQNGENSIVVAGGANLRVSPRDLDGLDGLLPQAKLLLLQFEVPLETSRRAMEIAARHNLKVILNPAPARAVSPQLLAQADYVVPNETEASLLTGIEVTDLASAEKAARKLLSCGVPVVIVTLGEKGALVVTGDQAFHVPARQIDAVDTTAAGDAFIGGLAVALTQDLPLKEAVRYATYTGTLAATRFGAQTSLPSAREVQSFCERSTPAQQQDTSPLLPISR